MNKTVLVLLMILAVFGGTSEAQNLYLVNFNTDNQCNEYITRTDFDVHYFNNHFLLGSGELENSPGVILLDKGFRESELEYFLVWLPADKTEAYVRALEQHSKLLYANEMLAVVKTKQAQELKPAVHGGLVRINKHAARLPKNAISKKSVPMNPDPFVQDLVALVNTDSIVADIQHMQDYGTRYHNTPQASEAEAWIASQFENYGLSVELTPTGAGGSNNVIAVQTGFAYPNTYVVVGGHYDSTGYGSTAPGADDNASGTAGVIEIARILSDYDFQYSIIYCAWSAEEIGLEGSGAWASSAAANNMDIMGYLNLDMIGYLHPGNDYFTSMIAPSSAQPLVDFYIDMVDLYVTDFAVYDATFIGGDSDHTSFNNNGYMGIFPFEDSENYSPYIHSEDDIIGLSYNSPEYSEKFVQTGVAFVATMAEEFNGLYPPMTLSYELTETDVTLNWEPPLEPGDNFVEYRIYKNDELLTGITDIELTEYIDTELSTGGLYEYYITAFYDGAEGGESSPSNTVSFVLGLNSQYFWDFESGVQNWTVAGDETGWIWGLSVGLTGNTSEYLGIDSDAAGSGTHVADYAVSPELDLQYFNPMYLEFDYGFRDWGSDFLKVVYRQSPSDEWVEMATLSPSDAFIHQSIEIPQEAASSNAQIAFWYDDNNTWAWYAGVDNVEIMAVDTETSVSEKMVLELYPELFPNPAEEICRLTFNNAVAVKASVHIYDLSGKRLWSSDSKTYQSGNQSIDLPSDKLAGGMYIVELHVGNERFSQKLMVK